MNKSVEAEKCSLGFSLSGFVGDSRHGLVVVFLGAVFVGFLGDLWSWGESRSFRVVGVLVMCSLGVPGQLLNGLIPKSCHYSTIVII